MTSSPPYGMRTRVTELLNIRYPVVQGGLAHLSFATLAAAVSNAGGLGQVGAACFATPEALRTEIQQVKRLTDKPFGVNIPIGHAPVEGMVEAALAEKPAVISITGGNPESLLRRIQQSGVPLVTMVLVAGVRAALKAEALGADAVIAVGFEGGGYIGRDDIGTMVLIPRIVESISIPVLASGGIADGRGLAAALALGAEGIEVGTRFVAVHESNAHLQYQQALVEAQETETVVIKRSLGQPARALQGEISRKIVQREEELAKEQRKPDERLQCLLPLIKGSVNKRAALDGVLEEGFLWAGQAAGLIHDIPTTEEWMARTILQAQKIAQRMQGIFQ
jgi:NAD(P)H-dependent flavin oxidoreductase YrpB (nitropropane dioxygenase family)